MMLINNSNDAPNVKQNQHASTTIFLSKRSLYVDQCPTSSNKPLSASSLTSSSSSSTAKSVRFDVIKTRKFVGHKLSKEKTIAIDDYETTRRTKKVLSLSTLPPSSSPSTKKSVRFGRIEIREYPIQLGHGSVPEYDGAPIGIGWKWFSERRVTVDAFEMERTIEGQQRRPLEELCLSIHWRDVILYRQGYSKRQIAAASAQCDKIRASRHASLRPTTRQKFTKLLRMTNDLLQLRGRN